VDEVSLEITPGEMVAIVGRSAAGKSSLAHLLLGLYRPSSGRILYDGVDLARLDVESVRRQLGVVVQTPYLFGASIRDNISLTDPSLPLEAVTHAAKLAQIHDEIAALPLGYDTLLVDGGHSLSGGQRQRIALARALAGDPAILLLDEATSNLDAVTESAIHDALGALGCTRIVIAHRLSTIRHADTILVLEAGRIVERGRHEDLVAHNGAYRELLGSQFEKLEATGGPLGFVRRSAS
jgi:ABC-type bacteriocin/lantibiotic exporter with double-glycine peptidase domain